MQKPLARLTPSPGFRLELILLFSFLITLPLMFDDTPLTYVHRIPSYVLSQPCGENPREMPFQGPVVHGSGLTSLPYLAPDACVQIVFSSPTFVYDLSIQTSAFSAFELSVAAQGSSERVLATTGVTRRTDAGARNSYANVSRPVERIDIRTRSGGYLSSVALRTDSAWSPMGLSLWLLLWQGLLYVALRVGYRRVKATALTYGLVSLSAVSMLYALRYGFTGVWVTCVTACCCGVIGLLPFKRYLPVPPAAAISLLVVFALTYLYWISGWHGFLIGLDYLSAAFDSLGAHLLRGRVDVDPITIQSEGFRIGDRTFIYFGPLLGAQRVVLNYLIPDLYGQWSRVSCLFAAMLSICAAMNIGALALRRNRHLNRAMKAYLWLLWSVAFMLGTPFFLLLTSSYIFHESFLWGLCGSLWALFLLISISLAGHYWGPRPFWALSTITGLLVLSRVTYAIPYCIYLAYWTVFGRWGSFTKRLCLLLPLVVCIACYGGYNWLRFSSPLKPIDFSYYLYEIHNKRLLEQAGGTFNPARIPNALSYYFGVQSSNFKSRWPFITFAPSPRAIGLYPGGSADGAWSLALGSPWLLALVLVGLQSGIPGGGRRLTGWSVLLAGLLVQCLCIMSYFWITFRYANEILPLLMILAHLGLRRLSLPPHSAELFKVLLTTVVLLSIAFTVAVGTEYATNIIG